MLEASFYGQLENPARLQIDFSPPTSTSPAIANPPDQLVPIMTAVIATSGVLVLAFSAAIIYRRKKLKAIMFDASRVSQKAEEAILRDPSKLVKNHEITMGATTTAIGTTNFMLAIPGYLTLNQNDYIIFEDKVLGTGATAAIYLGVLSTSLSNTFRFSQIALPLPASSMNWLY